MKKEICCFVALVLLASTAVLAQDDTVTQPAEEAAGEAPAACAADTEAIDVDGDWSAELAPARVAETDAAVPLPPPCPVNQDCNGPVGNGNTCSTNPGNCGVSGSGTRTDTGNQACITPGGHILVCPLGRTIIIRSAICRQCRCCQQPPPVCLCPNDCGSVVRWGCG